MKKSKNLNFKNKEKLKFNLSDPLFLEFYGILLGDGWIGQYKYKNKITRVFGITGHEKLDRVYFKYCKEIINKLFDRSAYLKERPKYNGIELQFSHQELFYFFKEVLKFPIGKKVDIKINQKIMSLDFEKIKYVIRGLFDTDGSFYFDKTPMGKDYPCISLQMKAPTLIKQVRDILLNAGFKLTHRKIKSRDMDVITLKGSKQLLKWMEEIGFSNPKHLNKIGPVAQFG